MVAELEEMLRRLIGDDIDLIVRLDPALPPIEADPGQLAQVIMNLAVNARDAMPKGGLLTISTRRIQLSGDELPLPSGPYVRIEVTDTGEGIEEQHLGHLFEPFFTTKPDGKGTGLGLSTVYGIVKQSGGHIDVSSQRSSGTFFTVHLPCVDGAVERLVAPREPAARSSAGSETILVVEDEELVRSLTCTVLRQNGYTVLEAADGDQALDLAAGHEGPLDLLLADVVMPRVSGLDVARTLKPERPEMRVLFMSGYVSEDFMEDKQIENGSTVLRKPFTVRELTREVRATLGSAPQPSPASNGASDDAGQDD